MRTEYGEWDYIIVGAGSAGCVLADKLSASGQARVLLLEAGPDAFGLRYKVPILGALETGNPRSDWLFAAQIDLSRNGREDTYSRGRVVGGSGSINATVYVRGNRADYDLWATQGNTGWSYDDLLPYFRAIEGAPDNLPDCYGRHGPLSISTTRRPHVMTQAFIEAVEEIGYPRNPAYNGPIQAGASITHVNQLRGLRCSSVEAFLARARKRSNFRLITGALAHRVVMVARRAAGVEFSLYGKLCHASAIGEVIISAGPFNSPKLLMLSGIGDETALRSLGIATSVNNPAVGKNLQDHCGMILRAHVNARTHNMDFNALGKLKKAAEFALFRGGAATYVSPAIAFVKSTPELDQADIEFQLTPMGIEGYGAGMRMMDSPVITLSAFVNRLSARGKVTLASADPAAPPSIQLPLLGDEQDMQRLIETGRIGRAILLTRALARYGAREFAPGHDIQTDDEWREYARATSVPLNHTAGGCRMGQDATAVVDHALRVRGADRLRVIDSSIIPELPNANINAITMVIAAKGADAVLAARS
jgi:choline dehydrogenase-like flavoprotein